MFHYNILKRMYFVFLLVLLAFAAIIIRIFYLQVFKTNKLNNLANSLWSRNLPLLADRGKIVDRNGEVLADNITTTSLVVVPVQIKDKEQVASSIAEILGTDYLNIYQHLTKKTSIERIHPEGRGLSYEIAEKIANLKYDGVYLLKESKRYYPYNEVLSHVLGYVGIDNQGLSGIELEYDDYLSGTDGGVKYYSDGKGNRLNLSEVYDEPISGNNISLTIDINIQLAVERELDNVVQKYNLETINRNLPIWATYEPGSTFKKATPFFSNIDSRMS